DASDALLWLALAASSGATHIRRYHTAACLVCSFRLAVHYTKHMRRPGDASDALVWLALAASSGATHIRRYHTAACLVCSFRLAVHYTKHMRR
ncbi:hypothetical protein NDU88_007218, partial [Pleurodeles waltl]